MLKSSPHQNTQPLSTEKTVNPSPPAHRENLSEKHNPIQEQIKFITLKIESFIIEFEETTTSIHKINNGKIEHKNTLDFLLSGFTNKFRFLDSGSKLHKLIIHKNEELVHQIVINTLRIEKDQLKKSLENSKNELLECIDQSKKIKSNAINEREIEYLLSITKQKIAAADLSIENDNRATTLKAFIANEYIYNTSFLNPQKMTEEQLTQQEKISEEKTLEHPKVNFLHILSKQMELQLYEAGRKVQLAEKNLHAAIYAVEKAKLAWDECIFNSALSNVIDDAIMTTPAPVPMTGDSQTIDEAQVYEQVIATGMEAAPELV